MKRYTTVEAFYTEMAEAEDKQARSGREHPATRNAANARATEYRRIAAQARRTDRQKGARS